MIIDDSIEESSLQSILDKIGAGPIENSNQISVAAVSEYISKWLIDELMKNP
jgi:hypothetical protein